MREGAERTLRGTERLRVTAAMPESFCNACTRAGISIRDVQDCGTGTAELTILRCERERALALAARCGAEVESLGERGLRAELKKLRHRLVFAAAALLTLLLFFASSLFIWEIEVTENDSELSDRRILAALAERGVGIGTFWPGLSGDMLRAELLQELPELCWAAVNVRGSRAEVQVRAASAAPEPVDEARPTEIRAARGAVITEMQVYEGEACFDVGETVLPGERLVTAERRDIRGTGRAVHARARIMGRCWLELSAFSPAPETVRVPSGGEKRGFGMIFGRRRLNFYFPSRNLPAECDNITTVYPLRLEGVFTLPFSLLRVSSRNVTRSAAEPPNESARLTALLRKSVEKTLDGEGQLVSLRASHSVSDGGTWVTVRAECILRIDREYPLS